MSRCAASEGSGKAHDLYAIYCNKVLLIGQLRLAGFLALPKIRYNEKLFFIHQLVLPTF